MTHINDIAYSMANQQVSKGRALRLAIIRGHTEAVRLLIEHGADLTIRDKDGYSYLHHAAGYGRNDIISLLIESGMDINTEGKWNANVLASLDMRPSRSVDKVIDTAKLLIAYGIDINNTRRRPLFHAVTLDNIPIAKLLLDNGADVNLNDRIGSYPIHRVHSSEMIDLLLAYGADINQKGSWGQTSLTCNVHTHCGQIIRYLIKLGADPTNTYTGNHNVIGMTLSEMAKARGNTDEIVMLIRDYEAKWAS